MKPDLSEIRQLKIEGRQAIGRRKSPKSAGVLANAVPAADLGIHTDKILLSKQILGKRHVDCKENKRETAMGDNQLTFDDLQTKKDDPADVKQLKELMLVHLDLIQHQQELIFARDKQIQSLRNDRDNLRCRLERMERRMSLLRTKDGVSNVSPRECASENNKPGSATASPKPRQHYGVQGNSGAKKRKGSLEPQNLGKRFTPGGSEKHHSRSHRGTRADFTEDDEVIISGFPPRHHRESLAFTQTHSPKATPSKRARQEDEDQDVFEDIKERLQPIEFRKPKDENVMRTDAMYYIPVQAGYSPEIKPKKPTDCVMVPSWQINLIPTGYSMEGTELLDDEIYLKRHQKPEQEERRRKRWDMQRMREREQYEKLQNSHRYHMATATVCSTTRGRGKNHQEEPAPVTFMPDPDEAKFIEVCDEVPVSAFGFPLPNVQSTDFDLPWFDVDRREREERHKSSRGKKR